VRRITWAVGAAGEVSLFKHCDLVIEAIAEDLRVKQEAFRRIEEAVGDQCLLATNTSSLSVTAIASACRLPGRVLGIHFFNPAPLMPLVEIVPALQTAAETTLKGRVIVDGWGKTTVLAADTPGFIVNRIARPFYREALRIFEEGIADKAIIDWAMRELGGFRMGPFELMDLIGNDINLAVSRAVFEGFNYDPRYRPSVSQQRLVEAGWLGRKSGRGHYDYAQGAPVPTPDTDPDRGQAIVDRILAMLINEAVDAVFWKVASPADIELSMTKGVNYPKGLLAWGDEIGPAVILDRMDTLQREYGEDRYRTSPLLRRIVESGENLLP
jgi:3-hydroxybutyryl-CoA dehydrogenase